MPAPSNLLLLSPLPSPSPLHLSSSLPLPFPHEKRFTFPKDDFLRNVPPYQETFQKALDTSYEGFAVDVHQETAMADNDKSREKSLNSSHFDDEAIQKAFNELDSHGIFQTDVTQPFGLGTRCAKTYVTRCLIGDEGSTYKYLGLRMFAYPWYDKMNDNTTGQRTHSSSSRTKKKSASSISTLQGALHTIGTLNQSLTKRTIVHLDALDKKRRQRQQSSQSQIHGRPNFDIALINRMTNAPDLKMEPSPVGKQQNEKCSVSWHAGMFLKRHTTYDQSLSSCFLA